MKKIKLILTSSAILLAILCAFALRESKQSCKCLSPADKNQSSSHK